MDRYLQRRDLLKWLGLTFPGSLLASCRSQQKFKTEGQQIEIPAQTVPVLDECDVLVCGGGTAGITAAVAAARHNAKVILIERWPFVGGMATAALVNGWHRSDREKMVIYGLVEEVARMAAVYDFIWFDGQYPRAHETHWFYPEGMKIIYQRLLDGAGVKTFGYTVAGTPLVADRAIRGVTVETKTGTKAILAKIVIDATGDGDIAAKAGLPYSFGRESDGKVQGMTLIYKLNHLDEKKIAGLSDEYVENIHQQMVELANKGELPAFNPIFKVSHAIAGHIDGFLNMCPVSGNPLDEADLSRKSALAREQVLKFWQFFRKHVDGFEKSKIEQSGCSLGIRESRRIQGMVTLTKEMVLSAQKQPDAIGHGVWMIDIHDPKGSGYTTYADRQAATMVPQGKSYHIPLRMCLNDHIRNLAVVGRCASSTHEAHGSVRVQTHCMVMGQGVGTAAALALAGGVNMDQVDVKRLQQTLIQDGVYLQDLPA